MIVDSKRRSSTVRANERRNDVINYLNKIITENRQNLARQSLNPLKIQKKIFRWMNDEILTPQCIENFLKHRHKEVVVIGIILPYQILKQCCEALVGQAVQILPLMLQACFLQKVELMNVTMMILLMEEDLHILESKADLPQKIIFNLATIWITSEQLAKKRIIDWELREEMFKKNNSLLVIKSHHPSLNQELTQRLQNLFWSVKSCAPDLIQKKVKVSTNNINRHAYQSLQQQQNEEFQFANIVSEVVKINLKRNWKYSRSVLCYPFLYYISCWMKEEQRDQKQLIEISLNWYFKNIEQQFIAFIKNFNIPIDQLYLRNSIATHKKTVFIDVRRHLSMFQNLFTLIDISSKYLQNLNRMFLQKQTDVYERNNKLAATQNLRKLQRIYEYRISRQFQQVFPNRKSEEAQKTDRNIKDFETDFRSLLQQYGEESIRVKSQLKTFNEFIMKKKLQYAEMLAKELRTNKKKYVNEAQELKDRLEIQMGVLHTLEEQIKELEDKKDKIDNENEQLKHAIQDLRVKRVKDIQSDAPSTGRKNQSKSQRKQAKLLTKKVNNYQQKQSKCCCQVM